jgi:hypothetical protein
MGRITDTLRSLTADLKASHERFDQQAAELLADINRHDADMAAWLQQLDAEEQG